MEIRKLNSYAVPFEQIVQGDVFLFDGKYYMRMEKSENYVNAVNLSNGEAIHFANEETVSLIDTCYLAVE